MFSIRAKLFSLVAAAFTIVLALCYWQVGYKAKSVAEKVIDRSLTQSSKILDTRISSRFQFIEEIANAMAKDARILPLIYDRDSATLQDLSLDFLRSYDFDILFFVSASGEILARADQPAAIGANIAGRSSLFDSALQGQLTTGFIVSRGKLMQTVAAPVFDNVLENRVRGIVVLSYELSNTIADEIVALTESQIGFFIFSRGANRIIDGVELSYMSNANMAKSIARYFENTPSAWVDIVESDSDEFRQDYVIDKQLQHSVIRRINGSSGNTLGFVTAMRSEAALTRPFTEIQETLLWVGGFGLAGASLMALLMALGLSRPIIRLVDLTRKIEEGDYPETNQAARSRDEIGALQAALVKMGNGLREKAQLEEYLADIANDIAMYEVDLSDEHLTDATQLKEGELQSDTTIKYDPNQTQLSASPSAKNKPGTSFDYKTIDQRYDIVKQLGSGALGAVYLAHDKELNEKIAIKLLKNKVLDGVSGFDFKEEIRLARKITHRNIVRTFDFGQWDGVYYITMEYVQGIDLGSLILKKGRLQTHIAIALAKQMCAAVLAAHQMGIIHRDLKPANMMINRRGQLQIMDFGVAMQITTPQTSDKAQSAKVPPENLVLGTPRYMAPEQFLSGQSLDERTDIYALGIILFALFTGSAPYHSSDFVNMAEQHLRSPIPSVREKNPSVSVEMEAVVWKAMAKAPTDRFQNVRELLDALNSV